MLVMVSKRWTRWWEGENCPALVVQDRCIEGESLVWGANVDGTKKSEEEAKKKRIKGLRGKAIFSIQTRRLKSSMAANQPCAPSPNHTQSATFVDNAHANQSESRLHKFLSTGWYEHLPRLHQSHATWYVQRDRSNRWVSSEGCWTWSCISIKVCIHRPSDIKGTRSNLGSHHLPCLFQEQVPIKGVA
jgi:hypothetical protein